MSLGACIRLRRLQSMRCTKVNSIAEGTRMTLTNLTLSLQHHGDRRRILGGSTSSKIVSGQPSLYLAMQVKLHPEDLIRSRAKVLSHGRRGLFRSSQPCVRVKPTCKADLVPHRDLPQKTFKRYNGRNEAGCRSNC
jgi:hypothetical protein